MSARIRLHFGETRRHAKGPQAGVQSEPHHMIVSTIDDLAPPAADEQERQVKGGRTTVRDSNDKYSNMEISR